MEFLQTTWAWFIDLLSVTIKHLDPAIDWINDNRYFTAIAILLSFLAAVKTFWPSKPTPEEENKQNSLSSSAEEIAKAAISSYEKGKQTAEADLRQDLQARDQQIAALTKAVEAMQTERQEVKTEAEQTTIDTALAHLKEGNPSEAEAIFEEILETQSKRDQEANKHAAAAARHIGALAFLHDTDKALKAYKRATELDPDDAEGWNELGHLQDRLGQLDNAIKSYETVLRLGNSSADQTLIATALGNLGTIYLTQGDLEKAEDALLKALKIDEHLGNKLGIANNFGNHGIIYQIQGNLEKAEDAQLKSLKIKEQLGNKQGMAASYGNLGLIYKTQGDLEKAEDAQLKSLKINEQLGNKQGIAISYSNLGDIYKNRGDLDKAEDAQLKSLEIDEQLGNKHGMAASYGNLGAISELKGNISEACTHWQKALALFTEVGAKPEIELVSGWLQAANCPDKIKPSSN